MRRILCVCALMVSAMAGEAWGGINDGDIIARGDSNDDGVVNLSDVIHLNSYLFQGGPAPPCMNQADATGNGVVDGSDSAFLLEWLYNGGPAPPSPGPYNTSCTTTYPYISCTVGC